MNNPITTFEPKSPFQLGLLQKIARLEREKQKITEEIQNAEKQYSSNLDSQIAFWEERMHVNNAHYITGLINRAEWLIARKEIRNNLEPFYNLLAITEN